MPDSLLTSAVFHAQVMPDIPYGDCFTVEARWNVANAQPRPDGTPRVAIDTHVMVNFGADAGLNIVEVLQQCRSCLERVFIGLFCFMYMSSWSSGGHLISLQLCDKPDYR